MGANEWILFLFILFIGIIFLLGVSKKSKPVRTNSYKPSPTVIYRPDPYQDFDQRVQDWDVIHEQLKAGDKFAAVTLYREQTGASLEAARHAIDRFTKESPKFASQNPVFVEQAASFEEVIALLAQGKKIHAIKMYRELTGVGLKEAKDAVEQLEHSGSLPMHAGLQGTRYSIGVQQSGLVNPEILQDYIRRGKKIEAIKYYRETTGVGLKEAKDAVDWLDTNSSM